MDRHNNSSRDDVYKAVIAHWKEEGVPPTLRDLCEMTHINSTSTVAYHLDKLRRGKMIEMVKQQPYPYGLHAQVKKAVRAFMEKAT